MLKGSDGSGVSHNDFLPGKRRAHTVRHDSVHRKVSAADHIARTRR